MTDKISEFNDESLRQIAKEVVVKRFVLKLHFTVFIAVNILLFVINFFTADDYILNPSSRWHMWALLGWGVGLAIHITQYIIFKKGIANIGTIALLYHTAIYIFVSLLLVFIDYSTDHGAAVLNWVLWPIGGWGAILILHFFFYNMLRPKSNEDAHKSWIERQVDAEMERLNKK